MSNMSAFLKAPGARLDYGIDWSDWLESGETILTAAWTITPTGTTGDLASVSDYISNGKQAVIWFEGGIDGKSYTATCTITTNKVNPTTSTPRTDKRSIGIIARER